MQLAYLSGFPSLSQPLIFWSTYWTSWTRINTFLSSCNAIHPNFQGWIVCIIVTVVSFNCCPSQKPPQEHAFFCTKMLKKCSEIWPKHKGKLMNLLTTSKCVFPADMFCRPIALIDQTVAWSVWSIRFLLSHWGRNVSVLLANTANVNVYFTQKKSPD